MRYEGLKNDVSYIKYLEQVECIKGLINNEIDNHETQIDVEWICVMLERLNKERIFLDQVKEWTDFVKDMKKTEE